MKFYGFIISGSLIRAATANSSLVAYNEKNSSNCTKFVAKTAACLLLKMKRREAVYFP